jgi:molybdenum cofactor cytidylyltransferase
MAGFGQHGRRRVTFDAVILAAGAGTRFGGPKLLAPYAGRPLIVHAVEAAFAAPVRWVSMVVGECAMVAWPALEWASDQGVGFSFIGGDHSEGMAASLRTACPCSRPTATACSSSSATCPASRTPSCPCSPPQ